MFRKPTNKSRKPHGFATVRKSFKERQNLLGSDTLAITIPREAVHHHNIQNAPFKISVDIDKNFNPVFSADCLGILRRIKHDEKIQKKLNFIRRTKWRASIEKESTEQEIEKLKQKFRAASYAGKCYDFRALFRKLDKDGGGTLDMTEFEDAVKKFLPTIARKQMKALIKAVDEDGNGEIDENEFVEFIGNDDHKKHRLSKDEALSLYNYKKNKNLEHVSDTDRDNYDQQKGKKYVWDMSINPNEPPKGPPRVLPDPNLDFAHEIKSNKAIFQIPVTIVESIDLKEGKGYNTNGSTNIDTETKSSIDGLGINMDNWWKGIMDRKSTIENEAYENTKMNENEVLATV